MSKLNNITCMCIGDPHFQDSNMKEVKVLTRKILDIVKEKKPTFVVCMGDILHNHEKISMTPFKAACEFLKELSKLSITYLLIGNHDYKNNQQFLSDNHAFNALKDWENMYIIDNVTVHEYGKMRFCFTPYVPPGKFLEALNTNSDLWELSDCIFAHQEFRGAKFGATSSELGDEWNEDYPMVISGHIHDLQFLGNNIIYTGSIMQHGYADTVKKYLWNFNFYYDEEEEDKKVRYDFDKIDLKMKQRKIVNIDFDDFKTYDPNTHSDYIVKLDVKGKSEQFKTLRQTKKYKELVEQGIKIAFTTINENLPELKLKVDNKNKTYYEIFSDLIKAECENEPNENKKVMMNELFEEINATLAEQ
jgi:DNA repair exonuclease SbcCD nuclease subunit